MGSVGNRKSGAPDVFAGALGPRNTPDTIGRTDQVQKDNSINPNYYQSPLYRTNCALCATAVVLNAMGYDVEAMPRDKANWRGFDSIFNVDYSNPDNYILGGGRTQMMGVPGPHSRVIQRAIANKGLDPNKIEYSKKGAAAVTNQIINKVKGWGNGAVGIMNVQWANSNSCHAINVINNNGKVEIYDAQCNRRYPESAIQKYLSRTSAKNTVLVRLDNATVKPNLDSTTLGKMIKQKPKKSKPGKS